MATLWSSLSRLTAPRLTALHCPGMATLWLPHTPKGPHRHRYGHALDDDAQGAAHELLEEAKRLISMPALADSAEILLSQVALDLT
jgi:hypothetical protein